MPADEDFDVVRRAWAAASRADEDAMLREFHPEIVAVPFGAAMEGQGLPGSGPALGLVARRDHGQLGVLSGAPQTFQRVGHRILVTGRWNARGRESGVELDIPASWILEVRDGKIAYWQTYTDHAQARRDAGLDD